MPLAEKKQAIIDKYGTWTKHNMHLGEGLYTNAPKPTPSGRKLRRMTQVVMDHFGGSVEGLRVLDLACLEGMYGLELARQGAQVVGIEGREANLAKARFVRDVWVVWIDPDHQTAALGSPDGAFGFVVTRPNASRADQVTAARQVLDFNGYRTAEWKAGAQ